jgi:thiol-disulfide isomerase/thioredoxin
MKAWKAAAVVVLVLASSAAARAEGTTAATPSAPLHLTSMDNAPIEVALAPDERALVLHFWATWCPDCIEELPALVEATRRCDGSHVRVLFVNTGEAPEVAQAFLDEHRIRASVVLDRKGKVWRSVAPAGLPANVTWTAEGLRTEVGPRTAEAWTRALTALGCARDLQ